MANISSEDNIKSLQDNDDKDFNNWRQPTPPESPKSPEELKAKLPELCVQNKSLCGIKDLSRLSRKRRTILNAKSARLCSRKRSEDKPLRSNNESKQRTIKKEPLPMKQRSLPQSFWLQPNSIRSSSLGQNTYSRLPPLFPEDHNPEKDLAERPVTPPEERQEHTPSPPKRAVISPPDTELLFSLFKTVIANPLEKKLIKRGRPKRVHSEKLKLPTISHEEDPCMVENLAGRLFPQLSLDHHHHRSPNARLSSLTVQTGSHSIELPTLAVDNNYPHMLSELAQVL